MAFCRIFNSPFLKQIAALHTKKLCETQSIAGINALFSQKRYFGRNYGLRLRIYKLRRKIAGPEKLRKRTDWDNWNYKSEIFAFNRRLYENISEDTLRRAFIHEAYIHSEEQKRRELDIPTQDVPLNLNSNVSLIAKGKQVTSDFLKRYLRYCYSLLPEEGISALHDHLLSEEVMSYISSNLGTKDLIFSVEYPPSKRTFADTLLAIVGAIAEDDSVSRAENFVLDFICVQLVGQDVFEIWDLKDPCLILNDILRKHDMKDYEPRLIFESGRNTIESIYNVGLYSDKIFLGRAPGETLAIAEELAAFDCLRKLFQIRESEKPISSKVVTSDLLKADSNPSITEWFSETLKLQKCL